MADDTNDRRIGVLDTLRLRFTEPRLEAAYRTSHLPGDLKQTRIAIAVGALLNANFAVIDAYVLTVNVGTAVLLRAGVATAILFALVILTFVPSIQPRLRLLATTGFVAYTMIYAGLTIVSDAPDIYLAGYAIVLFVLYVFLPVGFVTASTAGWLCTIGFALAILLTRPLSLDVVSIVGVQYLTANAVGMFALYWMDRFRRQDFLNLDRIDSERRRHHALLTRVLPESIADRLSGGQTQIVDTVADATILFADVVDFTGLTANCPSKDVVEFLDRLFADFDALAEQHGVEKIKTIGDSYMAAAGLTDSTGNHAVRAGRLALDMLVAADRNRPDGTMLGVRIGLNSGPVVAGVIGGKRFLYDVWGETVNLAQRLEAHGDGGCIQVTEDFARAHAEAFSFQSIGTVDLKGTGPTNVWRLTGTAETP